MLSFSVLRFRFTRALQVMAAASLIVGGQASRAGAQDAEKRAVIATVQKVFDAMRTRDTSLLKSAFDTSARLVGLSRRGTPSVTLMTPSRFGAAFSGAKAGDVWNERMYDPEVRIDGTIAQVWAYYTFHLNDTFSHCGIDAFMLVKVGSDWKITQLSDTERKEGCTRKD